MADYSLLPVDYQPEFEGVSLVPVDHDPFADDTSQPALMQPQPATSQSTADNPQPIYPPEIGPPAIGDGGQFSAGVPIFNKAADLASKVAYGMMQQFTTIPQRLIESNALDLQHLGEDGYQPQSIGPAVETGMTMAGAGLPMAERETLGALGGKLPPLDSGGLAMDTTSRLERARQIGFRTDVPLYHGSGAQFDEFKSVPTNADGWVSPGVSLAVDPEIANEFAANVPTNQQGYRACP